MDSKKRSRTKEMQTQTDTPGQGVGGRQIDTPSPMEGGGYLDIYKNRGAAFQADPRFSELAEMGLSPVWLRIAAVVGVDQFLVVWRILDEINDGTETVRDQARIRVPLFSSYLRYQRDKVIAAYAAAGLPVSEIQEKIKNELCVELGKKHIYRIIRKRNI